MSTYVNNLRLEEIGSGEASGTWGTKTNTNLELIGEALGFGTEAITENADTHTSTVADAASDQARAMYIKYTGALDSTCTITIGPNTNKRVHIIENATTDSGSSGPYSVIIKQGSGDTVTVENGQTKIVYLDGAGSGAAVVDAFADFLFGANLYIKNPATGDNSTANLYLQTAEADIAINDVIGKINFQAPNEGTTGDANLVAAAISAISEGDFSSSSNATKLSFATGASEAAAEKMSLSSAGKLVVASTIQGTALIEDSVTVTSSSNSTAIDLALGSNFLLDLGASTENTELVVTNPAASGLASVFTLRVIQDASARTITWMQDGSNNDLVYWPGGAAPTLTSTNNGIDYFVFITSDGGTSWYGFTAGQAMAIPT